jgi:hypothetical protein
MINEERQKLCEWLRGASRGWSGSSMIEPKMAQAADEIERLAKEVARLKDEYGVLLERTTNMLDMTVR